MADTAHEFLEALRWGIEARTGVIRAERRVRDLEKDVAGLPEQACGGVLAGLRKAAAGALAGRRADYEVAKSAVAAAFRNMAEARGE